MCVCVCVCVCGEKGGGIHVLLQQPTLPTPFLNKWQKEAHFFFILSVIMMKCHLGIFLRHQMAKITKSQLIPPLQFPVRCVCDKNFWQNFVSVQKLTFIVQQAVGKFEIQCVYLLQ